MSMILVTGTVVGRPDSIDRLRKLCQEHVARSRTEDGCEHHAVHVDTENALRLVFVERWRDGPALTRHFADPHARTFVAEIRALLAEAPTIDIYEVRRSVSRQIGA
jgi:quinol monooxygenase YgiN